MKKKLISISLVVLTIMFLITCIISYANTDKTIYVNLTKTDTAGFGYAIGDPTIADTGEYIWNITTYNSENVSDISAARIMETVGMKMKIQ